MHYANYANFYNKGYGLYSLVNVNTGLNLCDKLNEK